MDKCREEFEAYIVTRYPKRSKETVTRRLEEIDGYKFYTFKEIEDAWVIWQHQQAKVEKLQKRVDGVEKVIRKIRNGNYATDQGKYVAIFISQMLEQALKGGEA